MLTKIDQNRLDQLFESMNEANNHFLGYPFARDFDYSALWRFLGLTGNNLGDPFQDGYYRVDSREFEREVVRFFASLFNAEADDYWGYVTNGGTEGNIYGLYLARQLYPNAVVYCTPDTHYSVNKGTHLLGMESVSVRSDQYGVMDYDDLLAKSRLNADRPAIVVANIGTTMKEGKDDIARIRETLRESGIRDVYVHCDAALCGPFAPFLDPKPAFDFADGADSITISGHKFIGSPMPCGVIVARKQHVERVSRAIKYIGTVDTTLTGSRNAFTPIVLWYATKQLGREGLRKLMIECQAVAGYAVEQLNAIGVPAWRNAGALTVVFPKAHGSVKTQWQLATDDVSHLIAMPGTTRQHIDSFAAAIDANRDATFLLDSARDALEKLHLTDQVI
ncbi:MULTISPECIES: histidine decarboxylase [Burkholderia]|uniref:histidine decarboxylase n=1 Tax=Burkholderia TaxID=32008 RepID=UPI0005B74D90|nr:MULTISPECIES: histidine decarboxylase [Burkholderia]KIP17071.1 histidine decarboxylase [Burkholderia sp. MSHR3999]